MNDKNEPIHTREALKKTLQDVVKYLLVFVKWTSLGIITGCFGGLLGSLFHLGIQIVTELRAENEWILLLLPVGGIVIIALYSFGNLLSSTGTNAVIDSVRADGKVSYLMAPLIIVSTLITHLVGGSAGREGAALQLGGSIGSQIGGLFRLDEKDRQVVVLCGMSGVFSALFGTPLTASVFVLEVISVGILYYSAILPCVFSATAGYYISLLMGAKPTAFTIANIPATELFTLGKVILLSAGCALVSIIMCIALSKTGWLMKKLFKNEYIRITAGATIVLALTVLIGTQDYNGAGMNIAALAIEQGTAAPEAFILKILFTAITIGCGSKGGEIVPTFFIGATFGCVFGQLIGLDAGFAAAIGLIAVFCGVSNSPLSSMS